MWLSPADGDYMNGFIIDLYDKSLAGRTFDYELDDAFFRQTGGLIDRGSVRTRVTCERAAGGRYEFAVQSAGTVTVPCDRCLGDVDVPVDCTDRLTVRLGGGYADDGEVLTVPERDGRLDLSFPVYEFIVLGMPLRRVHEEGQCDEDMLRRMRENNHLNQ